MAKFVLFLTLICVAVALSQGKSVGRQKRDVTCAVGGNSACNLSCKARGYKDGSCAWVDGTGAYDCSCSEERAGIRCNLGGENVCAAGCMATGHKTGECVGDKCQCSDEMSSWGDLIHDIKGRL